LPFSKNGRYAMTRYLPLKIAFVDGSLMLVSSIPEAQIALQGKWRNMDAPEYRRASKLIAAAIEGTCRPDAAFEAFKEAAARQSLLVPGAPSPALQILDDVAIAEKKHGG
jgi:Protein of unknown function (DUF982)